MLKTLVRLGDGNDYTECSDYSVCKDYTFIEIVLCFLEFLYKEKCEKKVCFTNFSIISTLLTFEGLQYLLLGDKK